MVLFLRGVRVCVRQIIVLGVVCLLFNCVASAHARPVAASHLHPNLSIPAPHAEAVFGQPDFLTATPSSRISATGLNAPGGIAVDSSGGVYVADTQNSRVLYFSVGSTTASRVYGQPDFSSGKGGLSATSLAAPTGLALASDGTLYIADTYNNRVLVFPPGQTTATRVYGQPAYTTNQSGLDAGSLNRPSGIALDTHNTVYIADSGNSRVLVFPAGQTVATAVYGQPSPSDNCTTHRCQIDATSLAEPDGLAITGDGLYVADPVYDRVLYFPTGQTTASRVYGQPDFTSQSQSNDEQPDKLFYPHDVKVTDSNVYISDSGNHRVTVYSGTATTASAFVGFDPHDPTTQCCAPLCCTAVVTARTLYYPISIAIDTARRVYVADQNYNRVTTYEAGATTATTVYGQPHFTSADANYFVTAQTLTGPSGVSYDQSGGMYIADTGNHRVLYYPPHASTATQVYGQTDFVSRDTNDPSQNVPLSATTLHHPRAAAADTVSDGVYIADTDNRRVLYFANGAHTATRVYGQADFTSMSSVFVGPVTLDSPTGLAVDANGGLYVADAGMNRVVYYAPWHAGDPTSGIAASRVYGKPNFTTTQPLYMPTPSDTNAPQGVAVGADGSIYVADTGYKRVLIFPPWHTGDPTAGIAAIGVYGQPDLYTTTSAAISADTLATPVSVAVSGAGEVYVLDSANNRVMYYAPHLGHALRVYGQPDAVTAKPNTGGISDNSLNENIGNPNVVVAGVALDATGRVLIGDTGNNRVLRFPAPAFGTPTQLSLDRAPDRTYIGYPFGIQPIVTVRDSLGYLVSNATVPITLKLDGGLPSTTLTGTSTLNTRSGVAQFSDLAIATIGAGYTLTATSPGLQSDTSPTFAVTPPPPVLATDVIGQPDFIMTTPNTGGVSAASLQQPHSMAFGPDGGLYVADAGNNRVLYFPSGSKIATRVYGQASFSTTCADACGSDSRTATPTATMLSGARGVAVDKNGGLYAADTGNQRVVYYPPWQPGDPTVGIAATRVYGQPALTTNYNNNMVDIISETTLGSNQYGPTAVAVAPDGGLYVLDLDTFSYPNRVLYYPPWQPGDLIADIAATHVFNDGFDFSLRTGPGPAPKSLPTPNLLPHAPKEATPTTPLGGLRGMCLAADGGLYIVNDNTVAFFAALMLGDPVGKPTPDWTITGYDSQSIKGIGCAPNGDFYVIQGGLNYGRVLYYPAGSRHIGDYTLAYGQANPFDPGAQLPPNQALHGPWAALIASDNTFYLADTDANRILRFPPQAAIPAKMAFSTQPGNAVAGQPLTTQPVVVVSDAYNQPYTGPVQVTLQIEDAPGAHAAHIIGTATVAAINGVATFSGIAVDKAAPDRVLIASIGSLHAQSTPFRITPGTPAQVGFATQPGGKLAQADAPFPTQPVITAQDAYGNSVGGYSGTVTLTLKSGTGGAHLTGQTVLTLSNGSATAPDLAVTTYGFGYVLNVTSPSLKSTDSDPFDVLPAGHYMQMALRSQDDIAEDVFYSALKFTGRLTVRNMSGVTLQQGTPINLSFQNMVFDPVKVQADPYSLLGGARWATLTLRGGVVTLDDPLPAGATVSLRLAIPLTNDPYSSHGVGRFLRVKATMAITTGSKSTTFTSNIVQPFLYTELIRSGTAAAYQGLQISAPGNKKLVHSTIIGLRGTFFANREPLTISVVPTLPGTPINTISGSSGKVAGTLKQLAPGDYTILVYGWQSGVTGIGSFSLTAP